MEVLPPPTTAALLHRVLGYAMFFNPWELVLPSGKQQLNVDCCHNQGWITRALLNRYSLFFF